MPPKRQRFADRLRDHRRDELERVRRREEEKEQHRKLVLDKFVSQSRQLAKMVADVHGSALQTMMIQEAADRPVNDPCVLNVYAMPALPFSGNAIVGIERLRVGDNHPSIMADLDWRIEVETLYLPADHMTVFQREFSNTLAEHLELDVERVERMGNVHRDDFTFKMILSW